MAKFISYRRLSARRDPWTPAKPVSAEDLAYIVERLGRDMTWAGFCTRYAIDAPRSASGFKTAEKMFRSVCRPERLADVTPGMLTAFVDALRARGYTVTEARKRVAGLWAGIAWGISKGVIDRRHFPSPLTLDARWQWTPVRIRIRGAAA